MSDITNTADVIDSRDIVDRIAELRDEWAAGTEDDPDDYALSQDDWEVGLGQDGAAEIAALMALVDDLRNAAYDTPEDGVTLIHEDYFEDYARELADDLGAVPADYSWPASHIDWEAAATALQMDYTSVDFDGQTYWVR